MLTFFIISKLENYHLSKISTHFSALLILMLISGTRVREYKTEQSILCNFQGKQYLSKRLHLCITWVKKG